MGESKTKIDFRPYPGSREARDAGCRCPIIDNAHGRGYMCDNHERFVVNDNCPIHGGRLTNALEAKKL